MTFRMFALIPVKNDSPTSLCMTLAFALDLHSNTQKSEWKEFQKFDELIKARSKETIKPMY